MGSGANWFAAAAALESPARQPKAGQALNRRAVCGTRASRTTLLISRPAPDSLLFWERIQPPRKRIHRTVLWASLLSKQERNQPCFSGPGAAASTAWRTVFRQVLNACAHSAQIGRAAAAFEKPARPGLAGRGPGSRKTAQAPQMRKALHPARPGPMPGLLCFQEQIQGPKNASIARFDGLGCYQSRSKTGRGFAGCGRRQKAV